jgi:AraC-like DNA-binding protein
MDIDLVTCMAGGAAFLLGFELLLNPRKANAVANKWLAVFVITFGLAMLEMALASQNFQFRYPKLFELIGLLRFLTAPALYLAVTSFTSLTPAFRRKHLLHFTPFLFFLAFRIPFFVTGENMALNPGIAKMVFIILASALPLQSIVYWSLSLRRLENHNKDLRLFSSSTESNGLAWLKNFLLIVGVIAATWLNILYFHIDILIPYTPLLYLACLFFLAYFSLQQKEMYDFTDTEKSGLTEIMGKPGPAQRQKRLSEARLNILTEKLRTLIDGDEIYLDNELTLPALAEMLEITTNEASYLINEAYNENFYNFINRHRIEAAKLLLLSGEFKKLNILGIAYQSGFTSKSTFNSTFKKCTGMTPTQFVKQNTAVTA